MSERSAESDAPWWQRWRERRARTARANAIATAYAYGGPEAAAWAERRINERGAASGDNDESLWAHAPRNYAEQRALLEDTLRDIPPAKRGGA